MTEIFDIEKILIPMTPKQIISLTNEAAVYVARVMDAAKAEGKPHKALRVSVKKGGCSGFEYDFSYADEKQPYDETVEDKGVRLFVDPKATMHVLGSVMDYEEDDFSAKLVFRNPNETGACGCGKSVKFAPVPTAAE
jgi:iron-sulfur cluster assembly protein